jgi:fatty acid desaturase
MAMVLRASHRARYAHRAHHRFGTGVAETDALVAGEFGDQFRDVCG